MPPKKKKTNAKVASGKAIQNDNTLQAQPQVIPMVPTTMPDALGMQTIKIKGKEVKIPPRSERAEALRLSIMKKYKGRGSVVSADEVSNVFILRRPTGITGLDIALGGGFPAGGLSQVIGRDSSGKTYLANCAIAMCQKIYGHESAISLCMTEIVYDKPYSKWRCGVHIAFSDIEIENLNRSRAQWGHPPYTEDEIKWLKYQVGTIHHSAFPTAEELLEVAVQHVESNLYQIVMIDSFGALLTAQEAEAAGGIADKHRGGAAMPITQFMHRLHAALNLPDQYGRPNTTTVIGINQYRDNVGGGPYAPQLKEAGGWALKHGKLVDLLVSKGENKTVEIDRQKVKVGKEVNWEILKGKAGIHEGPKGSYDFYFQEHGYPFFGADLWMDLLVEAVRYGIIQQDGAWFSYNNERIGQGQANAAGFLYTRPDLYQIIQKEVYTRAGLNFIVREDV